MRMTKQGLGRARTGRALGRAALAALAPLAAFAAGTAAAQDFGAFDGDAIVAIPIEPDERPYRPEIPQPAEVEPPPAAPEEMPAPEEEEDAVELDPVQRAVESLRTPLTSRGIVPELSLTADWGKNLRGGASTNGEAFTHLVNLSITLDTETAFGLRGGTAFVNFQHQDGESASVDAGDFQEVSNIVADGRTQVSELWYEQRLADDRVRLKVGKIDAGGEFGYAQNAGEFLNASMSWTATNVVMPTYPDPAFGVLGLGTAAFVKPVDGVYFGGGVFDGALAEGVPTGSRGPKTLFGEPADLYLIGEGGLLWEAPEGVRLGVGRLALGAWHHTGSFQRFDDGTTESGTSGYYVILDQVLWRENPADAEDAQGVGAFAMYDGTDGEVAEVEHHLSAGMAWTGAIPTRDADVVGTGVTYAHFSDDAGFAGDGETTIEAFYRVQVTPWFSIKPDLQYILDPSGGDVDDALVAQLRAELFF